MTVESDGNMNIAIAEDYICNNNIEQPTYEVLCNREYLERAADLALKSGNGRITTDKRAFIKNRKVLMDRLEEMLKNETYKFSNLYQFKVYEPKERVIDVPNFFPDRIIERAVTDLIKPLIIDSLIDNTFGSIYQRGLHQLVNIMSAVTQNNKDVTYFVKIDARHYYQSIDHDRLKKVVRTIVQDDRIYKMVCAIIDVLDNGLAIGVYPSQYLANLYLSIVDWTMTEGYGYSYYYRYMDDIVILTKDKEDAKRVIRILDGLFKMIKLTIKNNVRIAPIAQGIDICGYIVNNYCVRIRKSLKLKAQRKAAALDKAGVSDKEWAMQMAPFFGWLKHANCANLWLSLVKNRKVYYKSKKKMKKLSDIKNSVHKEFGLSRDSRDKVTTLVGLLLEFHDIEMSEFYTNMKSNEADEDGKKREKFVVKFRRVGEEEYKYFITAGVLAERIMEYKSSMPFEATIEERGRGKKRYMVIV